MTNVKCYSCGKQINKTNESVEHVINNSIGGRLKSKELLCKPCNSKFGDTIDAELEQQIGMFTGLIGIKKERVAKDQRYKLTNTDGEVRYVGEKLKPHNKLTFKLPEKDVVLFESDKNYEKLKKRKQKELEAKYKTEYVEYVEPPDKKIWHVSNKLTEEIGDIAFGGKSYFRSIAKMCLNYYLYSGYDIQYCDEIIAFINGENIPMIADFFYPSNQQIYQLEDGELYHLIRITGDSRNKVLFAYIELFSMQNIIVKFNMNYKGPEILDTYCYNLLTEQQVEKQIKVRLTKHHLEDLYLISNSDESRERHREKYDRMLKIIESRQTRI